MTRTTLALILSLAIPLGALAAPVARTVDYGKSRIAFVTRQMNVPLEGQFRRFTTQVFWDESSPQTSRARFDIDVRSLDFDEQTMNDEAMGKPFFDARTYPTASFVSKQVKPVGTSGRYEVLGTLTIKGVSREVSVPMALKHDGRRGLLEGATTIRRLDYRIGDGEWADTKALADAVEIKFLFVLDPATR